VPGQYPDVALRIAEFLDFINVATSTIDYTSNFNSNLFARIFGKIG